MDRYHNTSIKFALAQFEHILADSIDLEDAWKRLKRFQRNLGLGKKNLSNLTIKKI